MFLVFAFAVGGVSGLVPGRVPTMRHARAVSPQLLGAQPGEVGRRAALLGAGAALAFSGPSTAWAKAAPPRQKKSELSNALFKLTFEQSDKLKLGELGWGDAEAKVLSKALTPSSATTRLFLNGNNIGDAGVAALAVSLRAGAAPKLKAINLAGNSGVGEEAVKELVAAREGLAVSFEQPATKDSVGLSPSSSKAKLDEAALYKLAFEQAETLFYSELGWGDEEAEVLSQELKSAKSLKKLFLNGNAIQCAGGQALAASIKAGGAPKLKILNLAGNRGLTEQDRRALTSARNGLTVNFVQLKQKSDAEVYIRADQGKLTNKGVIERASTDTLVDGSEGTCAELKEILRVDRSTIKIEQNLLRNMKDPEQIAKSQEIEQKLEKQVERLDKLLLAKQTKGCNDDKAKLAASSGYPLIGTPR